MYSLQANSSMTAYQIDSKTGVFIRRGQSGIGYKDGSEAKLNRVLDVVKDRSTFSEDFLPHMSDWPSEYHFSRKRHLVLRPFNIKRGDKVLELGAGCGAITRHLAELGACVTAVEGEFSRAAVGAKRCAGLGNVRFVADNFLDLELEEKFDWVLMIGVLEYSQKYGKGPDRQDEYLQIARRYLKPDGTLILAIENKLGLKYLNGAGEDHNGKIFYGTQDLYSQSDITTWGRMELREMLEAAGFIYSDFFAAFPDYKLPKVLFSEKIRSRRDFRAEELLHYTKSLDYRGKNQRLYDESLTLGSFRKNGLMLEVANSFVISARLDDTIQSFDPTILAHYFSVDRKESLSTWTQFTASGSGPIKVNKRRIDPQLSAQGKPVLVNSIAGDLFSIDQNIEAEVDYQHGHLLGFEYSKAIRRKNVEEAAQVLNHWLTFLKANFNFFDRESGAQLNVTSMPGRELRSVLIEGTALDCGPQNIIIGEVDWAFDLEWQSNQPVPLAWVLNRNAKHISRQRHSGAPLLSVQNIVGFLADQLEVQATTKDLEEAAELERQFQSGVAHVEPSGTTPLTEATTQ